MTSQPTSRRSSSALVLALALTFIHLQGQVSCYGVREESWPSREEQAVKDPQRSVESVTTTTTTAERGQVEVTDEEEWWWNDPDRECHRGSCSYAGRRRRSPDGWFDRLLGLIRGSGQRYVYDVNKMAGVEANSPGKQEREEMRQTTTEIRQKARDLETRRKNGEGSLRFFVNEGPSFWDALKFARDTYHEARTLRSLQWRHGQEKVNAVVGQYMDECFDQSQLHTAQGVHINQDIQLSCVGRIVDKVSDHFRRQSREASSAPPATVVNLDEITIDSPQTTFK